MEDGERIPIDLGYSEAGQAEPGPSEPRMTQGADGTLVIDILAPQPCVPSREDEIVVCAPSDDRSQYLPSQPPPAEPILTEKIGEALHAKIGPVEIGSIPLRDGTRAFGARVRF